MLSSTCILCPSTFSTIPAVKNCTMLRKWHNIFWNRKTHPNINFLIYVSETPDLVSLLFPSMPFDKHFCSHALLKSWYMSLNYLAYFSFLFCINIDQLNCFWEWRILIALFVFSSCKLRIGFSIYNFLSIIQQ